LLANVGLMVTGRGGDNTKQEFEHSSAALGLSGNGVKIANDALGVLQA
jgi:hypothetical protein